MNLGHSSLGEGPSDVDHPPAERLTLEDIDTHQLVVEAACASCKDFRKITIRDPLPGWTVRPPLLDIFSAGKMPCRLHGRPASRLRISRAINNQPGGEVVAEWVNTAAETAPPATKPPPPR